MIKLILIICLLCSTIICYSQTESTFHHYGIKDGLSQESVQVILKDLNGFLWIGTQDGLNRFDGYTFTVYKNEINNNRSISGNFINELLEDKDRIWIGTSNNGVSCYSKSLNNFNSVGVRNSNCTALSKDKDGNVYAAYLDNGLSVFSVKNNLYYEEKIDFFKWNNLEITSISISENQTLYVGTKKGRFFYAKLLEKPLRFKEIIFDNSIDEINRIFIDGDQTIWIGSAVGLFNYKINENKLVAVNIEKFSQNSTQKLIIYDIIKNENKYYVATDDGLFVLSELDKIQTDFKNCDIFIGDKNNVNSITSNRIYDLLFDDNLLWIGTNKLDALVLKDPVFKTINSSSRTAINNNHVYAIYKSHNYLFIGTRDGLNCIDSKKKVTLITKENTNGKLANNVIRGIAKDNKNNLWIATAKGVSIIDLLSFDPEKPKIKSIYYDADDTASLGNNNTRNIFVDHMNQVWIATYGGGVNRFTGNLSADVFTFQRFVHKKNINSLSSDLIYSLSQDEDNNYWIATKTGLNKIHFTDNNYNKPEFTVYLNYFDSLRMIKNSSVLTTIHDRNNIVWIGTAEGFYKFNRNTNKFTLYGEKEGLSNSVVYSILEDNNNSLWLSTNSGLFNFNKEKEIFINYTINDGLQSSEFNLGAQFKDDTTNKLYFGGINGVNYFYANDIDRLYNEGQLTFTSLRIKNKEINPGPNHKIIDQNITSTKVIYLKHNEFPFYLTFSDLNLYPPKNSRFLYKLIPNDDGWNELNDRKEIQVLHLPAGNYTLQVQGITTNKLWKKNPLEIQLHVSPPWYKSNLAYFFYTIVILSIILLVSRFILQRKFEQQEVVRLKELNDLKTELYTNITHEFRTPITVILGMAQSLKHKLIDLPVKTNNSLEMIERNSNNLLALVNQILDLSKLEKGKLTLKLEQGNIIKYLKYLTESFLSFAEEKQVDLVFYNEEVEIIMDYDADKISKIIINLISNAIKFCNRNDKIIVHTSVSGKNNSSQLVIKIKDTGIGIPKENLPYIFDRFYQVKNGSTKKHEGTGIGLALTKELVLLMNGNIAVQSKENVGTTVTVKLPITQNEKYTDITRTENIIYGSFTGITRVENQDDLSQLPVALVVEDNGDVASYIMMCLENKYQIIYAKDGEMGIEMALEQIPDIIISDIMMPGKNGLELCEKLKQDIRSNHIPIILLTAKATQEDKVSGLSHGADAYLTKPFNKNELLVRIEKLIDLRKILQQKYQEATTWGIKPEKTNRDSRDKNDEFINNIIDKISNNIDDSDFQTGQLAKSIHLSESQLYRKIKALTNTSTALFIRKVRLQKAKQLLTSSTLTVSEVAYSTGFNDPSWFSKCFKNEFGYSPSEEL